MVPLQNRNNSYSLYVKNVPVELDEDGLRKIFNSFGTVSSIFSPRDSNFAFVTYATYGEAETAIKTLDNQPPLWLRVEFRRNNTQNVDQPSRPMCERGDSRDFRESEFIRVRPPAPNKANPLSLKIPGEPGLSALKYAPEPLGYIPQNPEIYDPYDKLDYPDTAALWSRGCMTIDAGGRRHVSLGRGYTYYHIPDPYAAISTQISRVFERRNPGSYRSGVNQLASYVGNCVKCARDSTLCCSQCGVFYCSRDCQLQDWKIHQNVCLNAPPLVPTSARTAVKPNGQEPPRAPEIEDKPNGIHSQMQNGSSTRASYLEVSSHPAKNEATSPNNKPAPSITSSSLEKPRKPSVDLAARLQSCRIESVAAAERNLDFKRETWLSKSDFTEVQIVDATETGLYWVQKLADIENLAELMTKLHTDAPNLPQAVHPVVGKIYAAKFEGIWHRAMILSLNPTKIEYIDYGTVEEVAMNNFKDIKDAALAPRFARCIRLAAPLPKTLATGDTISVKMISVDGNDVITVEVRSSAPAAAQQPALPSPKATPPVVSPAPSVASVKAISSMDSMPRMPRSMSVAMEKPKDIQPPPPPVAPPQQAPAPTIEYVLPSVLDTLAVGVEQIVADIVAMIDKQTASVFLVHPAAKDDFQLLLEPLRMDCEAALQQCPAFAPKMDDLVCVRKVEDEYWLRCRVVALSPELKVASLDEGVFVNSTSIDKIIPLPVRYRGIHTFTASMHTSSAFPALVGSCLHIKITGREFVDGESVVMAIVCDEGYNNLQVKLGHWQIEDNSVAARQAPAAAAAAAAPQHPPLHGAVIKNKSRVTIQTNRSASIVYLRPMENEDLEKYDRLLQDVAKAALSAENLTCMPQKGDLVLAKFNDGNFYRALVLAVEEKMIKIVYIDFGNNEISELSKLKVMPESIKMRERVSCKATLKGIQQVPPTREAMDYLGMLAAREIELICNYDGAFEDGVILKSIKGDECVNDTVNELLTPTYERPNEELRNLFMVDMDMAVLGPVGDTIKACFMDTIEAGARYVFAPIDKEMIAHISEVLPELLNPYCEKSPHYIPRNNELCIAKFDNGWYRGCCINHSLKPNTAEIYFVDFGNIAEVEHEDIRKMQKDFLKPPALGCICIPRDLTPANGQPSPKLMDRLSELLITNEPYTLKILKKDEANWIIDLPEVRQKLIAEGLIN